jgi:hypothetical protein
MAGHLTHGPVVRAAVEHFFGMRERRLVGFALRRFKMGDL